MLVFMAAARRRPRIDRTAREGLELARCYSFPVCTPIRAMLLTGPMPIRYGRLFTVVRPWSPYGVPETMGAFGYQTAYIGKLHQCTGF
jgi:arylsulfatase A-like enzyme